MKKVLIVEDDAIYTDYYKVRLAGKIELLIAEDIKNAIRLFDDNTDLAAIVMDACLDNPSNPDTMKVVEHIRRSGYTGPMIANSSVYNTILIAAGCNVRCNDSDKYMIPEQLIELLGL